MAWILMTTSKETSRWGVPWFYGPVATYPEMRATQYWIRPFNVIGRLVRRYILDMNETLNWPDERDDVWYEPEWDILPCPTRLVSQPC